MGNRLQRIALKESEMGFGRRNKSLLNLSIWMLLGGFVLASCATAPPAKDGATSQPSVHEIESSARMKAMNEKLMMSSMSSRRVALQDYKIGPDDLIEISVFEDEKLSRTVRVSSQGNISLPLLGILRAKGLTSSELEKEVRDLLAEKYLKDPHVTVFVKEYRNQRISLMGAVNKPGVYDFNGQKTILDLLAMAGGLRDDAGALLFLIRSPETENSRRVKDLDRDHGKTFIVGLEELLIKGDEKMNLLLMHGDVVNIPPAGKFYVGGEVRSPGGFILSKRMTVSKAITVAGGMTPKAGGSEAKIFRYSGNGDKKEVLTVDVYAIQKGQEEDVTLKENDVIIVPKSGTKTVFLEFWDILKGRIAGWPMFY
jgi:polysaccharide export outer membrane protein